MRDKTFPGGKKREEGKKKKKQIIIGKQIRNWKYWGEIKKN